MMCLIGPHSLPTYVDPLADRFLFYCSMPNHIVWLLRCINSIVIDSPGALTYLESRTADLIPIIKSSLQSEGDAELVLRTASVVASCLRSPVLHKSFLEAELPRVLVDLATR